MSSLLHQAVELAQAGQREQARELLWQYLQTHPDSDVAWLWLASVAADQPEYVRALNEVLRIDPANARARSLLDDFNRQYGPVPSASTPPYVPGGPPADERPSPPPPAPPATPAYQPPQPRPVQPQAPQQQPPSYGPPPYAPPDYDYDEHPKAKKAEKARAYVPEGRPERRPRRRGGCGCLGCGVPGCGCAGCGCWQGCLVGIVLLILLPAVIFGSLSYANFSLGPLDWFMTFLPDDFGTKTIRFETDDYRVEMEAPRSWFLVSTDDDMWLFARDVLSETVRFTDEGESWGMFEDQDGPVIVETSPITLHMNGDVIKLVMAEEQAGNYTCSAIEAQTGQFDGVQLYDNGLCGYYLVETRAYTGDRIFSDATPPSERLFYTIVVPVDESTALQWELQIAEDMEGLYRDRIENLIATILITRR